jgi:tetratricopeptide (TPR) repeat protein
MAFRATVCASCGRDIHVPTDVRAPACPYCGHIVQEGAAPAATISTLLGLAHTALAASNAKEASEYFNRVLEADPTNSEAWLGKGKAAGWQSTLSNIRLPEMLIAFHHAIANTPDESKNATANEVSEEVNRLVVTLYGIGRKHMLEYVSLPNIWPEYVQQVAQMLDGLSTVNGWVPDNKATLTILIQLCKDSIEGVSFRDKFHNNAAKAWNLTPDYEASLRDLLKSTLKNLKNLDPSYEAPVIQKKTADACFVVTATMGDFDHPKVTFMRRFRDEWLLERSWGVRVVKCYYTYGPIAADFIAASPIRRRTSYYLIVQPSAWIAQLLLQRPSVLSNSSPADGCPPVPRT